VVTVKRNIPDGHDPARKRDACVLAMKMKNRTRRREEEGMKSERAIVLELKRVEAIRKRALPEQGQASVLQRILDAREQFGAQQALGWVLEMNCMAPSKLATLGRGVANASH